MEPSVLAQKMLEWEAKKKELDTLEKEIQEAVLEIGKTYTVGSVRASFSNGRRVFDYEGSARRWGVTLGLIEKHQHRIEEVTVDWKAICEELKCEVAFDAAPPSVKIKIL